MADKQHPTPMLDELENGPWPSFVSGIKRLRDDHPDERIRKVTNSLLGQIAGKTPRLMRKLRPCQTAGLALLSPGN